MRVYANVSVFGVSFLLAECTKSDELEVGMAWGGQEGGEAISVSSIGTDCATEPVTALWAGGGGEFAAPSWSRTRVVQPRARYYINRDVAEYN